MMLKKSCSALLFLCLSASMNSQSVVGKWKTIDDGTGNPKALVNLYLENGKLYGKVVRILEPGKENATCIKCKGELKDKPVEGMVIIDGFLPNDDMEYKGKRLFDPEQAMTFRGKIWLDPDDKNKLKVRGYLAFLYRTQTWLRAEE